MWLCLSPVRWPRRDMSSLCTFKWSTWRVEPLDDAKSTWCVESRWKSPVFSLTVKLIYIGRQVIRQSIMDLFPVAGVHPRIYLPWQTPPPDRRTIFFFCVFEVKHDEEMVGDRERRQPGGEFESTTGSVQAKDHERYRSIFHQPLSCWRITGSECTKYWI